MVRKHTIYKVFVGLRSLYDCTARLFKWHILSLLHYFRCLYKNIRFVDMSARIRIIESTYLKVADLFVFVIKSIFTLDWIMVQSVYYGLREYDLICFNYLPY